MLSYVVYKSDFVIHIQLLLFANSELADKLASVLTVSTSTLPFTLSLLLDLRTKLPSSKSAMVWRKECELNIYIEIFQKTPRFSFKFHRRTHGPLIHSRAVEKVARHVEDAVSKGAQVLIGGKPIANSNFFLPTILSEVPSTAVLNTEETFGPLAALCKFETEEEVIRLANDTDVGLAGYFFSRDVGRVWRVAERLEVGMVGANTGFLSQAVIPFGGVKESGLGREGGHGIEEYMNTKLIVFGGLGA